MYVWEEAMNSLSVHAHCGFVALYHRKPTQVETISIPLIILYFVLLFNHATALLQWLSTFLKCCW